MEVSKMEDTNGKEIREEYYLEKNGTEEDIQVLRAINDMDRGVDHVGNFMWSHPEYISGAVTKEEVEAHLEEVLALPDEDKSKNPVKVFLQRYLEA